MSHRASRIALGFVALLALAASTAHAGILLTLDTPINGQIPVKIDDTLPFLTATFFNSGIDEVTLTLDASNLQSDAYISTLLFNLVSGQFSDVSAFPPEQVTNGESNPPSFDGGDEVKAGLFSNFLGFNTVQGLNRFNGGEILSVVFTGAGLVETDFLAKSLDKPAPNPSAGGWYLAAEVFSGASQAGSIGASRFSTTVVPEPGSIVLASIGALCVVALQLRRRRSIFGVTAYSVSDHFPPTSSLP